MARRTHGFVRGRGARRETVWFQFVPILGGLAAGASSLGFTLNAAALALRPFTVVRTRGIFHVRSDQAAASEVYAASLGLAVVSEQATAIGITAVPTPYTDMGSDLFFVYEQVVSSLRFVNSTGFTDPSGLTIQFDSKAMREVDIGQDIAVTTEALAAGNGVDTVLGFRMLVKVH